MGRNSFGSLALAGAFLAGMGVAGATPNNPNAHFTVSGTQILKDGQPFRAVGCDHFMLGYQFHGNPPNTPVDLARDMGTKALQDAKDEGIAFFRFSVFGYGSVDFQRWRDRRPQFLAELDMLCDAAHAQGVYLVPSLMWNYQAICDLAGESQGSLFKDPNSVSWGYLRDYVASVVGHLKGRDEIIMWELANELAYICDANPQSGNAYDRIATSDMIAFMTRFAYEVKNADPDRPVTSGYGMPTTYAQHLRNKPQWNGGGSFGKDSVSQFQQYIRDMHPYPIDVVSVHFYNPGDNTRFQSVGPDDASTLSYAKQAADLAGKPLFVGEFGDTQPNTTVDPTGPFEQSVIANCGRLGIPLAAAWDFEFYQFDTTTRNTFSIDPGYNDQLLAAFRSANEASGAVLPRTGPTPPHVVVTGPFEGQDFPVNQALTVTTQASDGDSVANVQLLVDGVSVATATDLPYSLTWTPADPGAHTLVALVTNAAGLATRSEPVHIIIDGTPASTSLAVLGAATGWSQVAPDSFASAYGQSLASAVNAPGVTVSLTDSSGANLAATVVYTSPGQINFVVPAGAAAGPATVTVTSDQGSQATGLVEVVPVTPGVFQVGNGIAAAWLVRVHTDGTTDNEPIYTVDATGNVTAVPVNLGVANGDQCFLCLWGTGLRAAQTTGVTFNEVAGVVTFSGAEGVTDALDQVNVLIPASLDGTGGTVNVQVVADGLRANVVQIAIQ
jgi:uncharacterized protein (TIGR03437 family)